MQVDKSAIAGDRANEMDDFEKFAQRLKDHRWLVAATFVVFIALALFGQLSFGVAIAALIVLLVAASLSPVQTERTIAVEIAGQQLAQRNENFISLHVIPDPVMIVGPSGNIEFVNTAFEHAFGSLEIGSSLFLRFRNPDIQNVIHAALSGDQPKPIEYLETRPVDRWFSVSAGRIQDNAQTEHYLVHFQDLSETKHTEKMRSDFIANASHELRTPLASLTGFIETLAGPAKDDPDARNRFLGIMQDQAERMSRLIDDLLTLSRFETSRGRASFEEVDLKLALGHVIDALKPMAVQASAQIKSNINSINEPTLVHGNRDELIQLFENLVENAIKYGGEEGEVEILIKSNPHSGDLAVKVCDKGPGIPEEHLPRLVERFYRVDEETSRGKQGTGLGLSIVRHIAQRHSGRLNIQSELGRGSTFTVTLPALQGESFQQAENIE